MRKPLFLVIALSVACSGCSSLFFSRQPKEGKIMMTSDSREVIMPPPEAALPEREQLIYEMKWVGIPVGTLTTSVKGVETINGRKAYVLEAEAKSNKFCSMFYKIDDRFVSYMDVEKLYTLRHEVDRSEGRYRKAARTDFDQVRHRAHYKSSTDNTEKDFDIPPDVQDILTASYYFMLLPLKLGDRVEYSVCNNEQNYRLIALIGQKAVINLKSLGERESFMVQPFAELKGEKVDKGRVTAYYSFDKRRLPLYAIVQAPVFTWVAISLCGIIDQSSENPAISAPPEN